MDNSTLIGGSLLTVALSRLIFVKNYKRKKAICVFPNHGYAELEEDEQYNTKIILKLNNLTPGKHGFHIHKCGDLRRNCDSTCEHYNPFSKHHGGRDDTDRHVGDLGNIEVDENGVCNVIFIDKLVKLSGEYSVIGRAMVIHEDEDDLGKGGNEESLKTGNAGKRISCGIIGILE